MGGIHVEIAERTPANPGVSLMQFDGETTITGGSTLVAPDGVVVTGGVVLAAINAPGTRADIEGDFTLDGGTVAIYQAENTNAPSGTFRIVGDVTWLSGTYYTSFDPGVAANVYTWEATGTFYVGADTTLQATARFGLLTDGLSTRVMGAAEFVGPMSTTPSNMLNGVPPGFGYATKPKYSILTGTSQGTTWWYLHYDATA